MAGLRYTETELQIMQHMAHGLTREQIADKVRFSPSTVARISRNATDKAVAPGAPIVQGIAAMVAEGSISVPFKGQRNTAHETALHWLHTRIMSCLDPNEFAEIRAAYKAMSEEQTDG